jgi:hypothetical protein
VDPSRIGSRGSGDPEVERGSMASTLAAAYRQPGLAWVAARESTRGKSNRESARGRSGDEEQRRRPWPKSARATPGGGRLRQKGDRGEASVREVRSERERGRGGSNLGLTEPGARPTRSNRPGPAGQLGSAQPDTLTQFCIFCFKENHLKVK